MKTLLTSIITIVLVANYSVNAQIRIVSDGKVGIGGITAPVSALHLNDNQWIRLNAPNGKAGILFYETQGSTPTDVQYGGKIFYDETADHLKIVTKQNNADVYGLSILRTYGNVGVRMEYPSYSLDVNGSVRATSYITSSDIRLKKDITSLNPSVLQNLTYLNAITYKPVLKNPLSELQIAKDDTLAADIEKNVMREERTLIGFSAQEVKNYFPDLVSEDDEGYLAVDYMGLIPVLVEAWKQQSSMLQTANEKITELEEKVAKLTGSKLK